MAAICNAMIHLCAVRITRLDQLGNPAGGPNNVYVSGNPMMLTAKPVLQAGDDKTLVGGCDCIIAEYKGFDKLKRFDLELDLGVIEPGLVEMMTGAPAIVDGSGFPIGWHWASQLSCANPVQPNVCIEAWQDLWEGDHQNPPKRLQPAEADGVHAGQPELGPRPLRRPAGAVRRDGRRLLHHDPPDRGLRLPDPQHLVSRSQ